MPDLLRSSTTMRGLSDLRRELSRASTEMATGKTTDILAATQGRGASLYEAGRELKTIEAGARRLALVETRYQAASDALTTVRELASAVRADAYTAVSASDGVGGSEFAADSAKAALSAAFDAMRTTVQGRAVFAGSEAGGDVLQSADDVLVALRTALASAPAGTAPAATVRAFFADGGDFETSFYTGGDEREGALLESGQRVAPLPRAVSSSLRQVFAGLAMVSLSLDVPSSERTALLREGGDVLREGEDAVVREEARLGRALSEIDREAERLTQRKFAAEKAIDSVIGRDPFEAASEVQALEARLQAAYTIAGRSSQLRLANFLR
jgi:flagellar hook-associated protein 3 FlgL